MPSIEFSADVRDIKFVIFEQRKIEQDLLQLEKFQDYDRDTLDITIDEMVKFAVTELAPTNREGDETEAIFKEGQVLLPDSFKQVYNKMREAGWFGLHQSPEWGGQGFPELFGSVFSELTTGANTSFSLLALLNHGSSHLIEAFGTEEQKQTYCSKIYTGEWGGSMCLTEPQAGSDVGAAVTTATPDGGHYLIQGTKIFISNGEHDLTDNIIHLVLARVPGGPKGSKGISLFVVPKYLVNPDGTLGEFNDVNCDRIEHKMGIKASPTCVITFGDKGQCRGYLLGTLHHGMKQMFQMMNEARLGVGIQGLGNASAAYMSALGYAQQRKQGSHIARFKDPNAPRTEIVFHPDVRRMLMTMKAYVEGMRALLYSTAVYVDMAKYHPDPDQREFYFTLVELLTPICKSYASDMGFKVTELAVQTFGGYGYTQEYPVEQYLRDAKIASIYEGTNGIQAIDLFARKVSQKEGYRFKKFVSFVSKQISQWSDHALHKLGDQVQSSLRELQDITVDLLTEAQSGNMQHGLLNACTYLTMFGNVTLAFYLAEAAVVSYDKLQSIFEQNGIAGAEAQKEFLRKNTEAAFYHGKIRTAEFFNQNILTQNLGMAATILSHDDSAIDVLFMDEADLGDPLA